MGPRKSVRPCGRRTRKSLKKNRALRVPPPSHRLPTISIAKHPKNLQKTGKWVSHHAKVFKTVIQSHLDINGTYCTREKKNFYERERFPLLLSRYVTGPRYGTCVQTNTGRTRRKDIQASGKQSGRRKDKTDSNNQ
jgi:hypothetical protein